MKVYLLFLICLLSLSQGLAQDISFNKVPVPEEVISQPITCITQDLAGNIWFSCSGLYQFDGVHMKSYVHDPLNPASLPFGVVECIYPDRNGNIWAGVTGSGLEKLDPKTGIFTRYKHNEKDSSSISGDTITCILQDREGFLWIGTDFNGLNKMDPKTGKFTHYRHIENDPTTLSADQVRVIYEDKKGTLWIGGGSPFHGDENPGKKGGLSRFNPMTGKFTSYLHNESDPHSLIDDRVRVIFEDSHGNFWVGTAGDGLHTLNRENGKFERHTYDPGHPENISRPPLGKFYDYVDDHITFITEDSKGAIWIGTMEAGIVRYDPAKKKINYYYKQKDSTGNFSDSTTWWAFKSRDGVLWTSTWTGNLFRFDPTHLNISQKVLYPNRGMNDFLEEPNGDQYFGLDTGLLRVNKNSNGSQLFVHDEKKTGSISDNGVVVLYKDKEGRIWAGSGGGGLNLFNPDQGTFKTYKHEPKTASSLSADFIFCLYEDAQSNLWVGTLNGLDRMDIKNGVFTHYKTYPADTITAGKNMVTCFLEDSQHNFWVGNYRDGGLQLFDRKTGQFKTYLSHLSVVAIYEDGFGKLWAGTESGLYYQKNGVDSFSLFTDRSTGSGIITRSIVEDNDKNLWISSPSAIYRISKSRDEVSRFGKNFGISANTLRYLSAFKTMDGQLMFGSQDGYYFFYPDKVNTNKTPPEIVLTDFRISDRPVKPGSGNTTTEDFLSSKQIRLSYDQDVFSFYYNVVHYGSPEANSAMYMLENYDKNWRPAGSDHIAYYYNVPPGRYTFRIKAVNSEGVWAEKSIEVIVAPPWWRAWWAYCIYGILAGTFIYSLHRLQKQRVIRAERERTRERDLAQAKEIEKAYNDLKFTQTQLIQAEKMASLGELTAGIAHEIQNPLNFMNNFSEVNTELIDEMTEEMKAGNHGDALAIAENIRENERKINIHGKRADSIVKSMLQHSRTGSGKKETTDINALTDEYLRLAFHGLRAKDPSFNTTMKTDFDPDIGSVLLIAQDIGRVLLNLYNNAFYAVKEKRKSAGAGYEPTLWVSTKQSNGQVEITVKDNGNGIPQKVKEKIYQPFFTTKPPGQGTGLGLSMSYDIIKSHGGEIKMETREGEGTTFVVQLPS
jgi:signal transduction histidine kinase/ligand-binding sensor domain-containing protein